MLLYRVSTACAAAVRWAIAVACVAVIASPGAWGDELASLEAYSGTLDATHAVLERLIRRYDEDYQLLRRQLGRSGGPDTWDRLEGFHRRWRAALESVDFDQLNQDGRIDYLLLANHLARELKELEHQRRREAELAELLPFATRVRQLEEARRALEDLPPRDQASQVDELARDIRQLQERVKSGTLKATVPVANRAIDRLRSLRGVLDRWYEFHAGYDPEFSWWVERPHQQLLEAWDDYTRTLREQLVQGGKPSSDPVVGDPIGREALLDALQFEWIPYTPEELVEIANREFAWCEAEYRKAAREMGMGDDWRKALTSVTSKHVEPGAQPRLIRDLADESVLFIERHQLVTVPELCKTGWRMEMMTAERQRVNPYFTGGEVISVSFPTSEMDHEDKLMSLRGNNIHFARATVHHELIPGHHLQLYMADRHRTHRRLFRTPFLVEGWALHWELLLWDLDFARSPEDRVGMLFWRSHRCARIIFSLGYHLGTMSEDECVKFLVDRVGHEPRNATAEVRRSVEGSYDPLYQAAYMLGGLQLRSMYRELVDSGRMTPREFHDAVLRENAIPIELIRASLTSEPLTADRRSTWRFYPGLEQSEPPDSTGGG